MSAEAVRIVARGRVQGVGLRVRTRERAQELGALGWVRNEDDGSVRAHVEGPPAAVAGVVAFVASIADTVEQEGAKVEGHEQFAIRGVAAGRFTVLELERGFALTLEVDGVPRVWTLPKAPSMDPADKRFAVVAGDLPAHAPVWDAGPYEQGGRVRWPEAIDRGHAVFVLHGARLRGGFALQRTPRGWLLVKRRDGHAAAF